MGVGPSHISRIIHSLKATDQCRPCAPHVPFPSDRLPPGSNHLVQDFRALPSAMVMAPLREKERETDYWWTDVEFVPGCDAMLMVTSSVFEPRQGVQSWMPKYRFPAGRIFLADFRGPSLQMVNFVGSTSSVFPKVQPHPLGQHLVYAGRGSLSVLTLNNEPVIVREKDIDNAAYQFCAIAPNGVSLATICKGQGMYEVKFFLVDLSLLSQGSVYCHKVCPEFRARSHNEHVELKWSKDSAYLAVSCSSGVLFLLSRSTLQNVCTLCPERLGYLSTAAAFDFHPRYHHQLLAVADTDGDVTLCNVEQDEALWSVPVDGGDRRVDCLRFDSAGTVVGLTCDDLTVRLLSAEDGTEIWCLNMAPSCPPDLQLRAPRGHPNTIRLAFSQEGGHIATAHCDGHVRVWAVPRLLSLQYLCRQALLRRHDDNAIRCLPVPEKVKDFLLPQHPIRPEAPVQDAAVR